MYIKTNGLKDKVIVLKSYKEVLKIIENQKQVNNLYYCIL